MRDTWQGHRHVPVLDRRDNLLKDVRLGKGPSTTRAASTSTARRVWAPVAECRPNSRAMVYRFDPQTYHVTEAFRVADHVGGVVQDPVSGEVRGRNYDLGGLALRDLRDRLILHRSRSHGSPRAGTS